MLIDAHCTLTGLAKFKTVCRIGRPGPLHEQSSKPISNSRRSSHIQPLPHQVALLFLATDGQLPHEAAWRSWFRSAEGLLPVADMMAGGLPPQLGLCSKALANSRGETLLHIRDRLSSWLIFLHIRAVTVRTFHLRST